MKKLTEKYQNIWDEVYDEEYRKAPGNQIGRAHV